MYTDDNNSESDNDKDEKVFFILLILITDDGHQTLYITEGNIRIRPGFKSGSLGDQGNSTLIL